MKYTEKLKKAVVENNSCLCVGLDPDLDRIPAPLRKVFDHSDELVYQFLTKVIDATSPYCAAYKPNLGFFEALGASGLQVFKKVIDYIPNGKIIIADAKRGDISTTAKHYARAYFETFNADAVTINPLMGFESLTPFLAYPGKGIYTLTLTSNPGAKDFFMQKFSGQKTMGAYISKKLQQLQKPEQTHLGMVVGAPRADGLAEVIQHHPNGALLIPGVGAQGGSIPDITEALHGHSGIPLVNSSRSILYAGRNRNHWVQAVSEQAEKLKEDLKPITRNYV